MHTEIVFGLGDTFIVAVPTEEGSRYERYMVEWRKPCADAAAPVVPIRPIGKIVRLPNGD